MDWVCEQWGFRDGSDGSTQIYAYVCSTAGSDYRPPQPPPPPAGGGGH